MNDRGHGSDIGRMIDEEIAKSPPEKPTPLQEGEIKDTRTPAERAASMDRARREREAEKEIAGLRGKWDAADKKKAEQAAAEAPKGGEPMKTAERELKKNDAQLFASEYGALKALPRGSKEADEKKSELIGSMVEQKTLGNTELGTRFVKLGILYPEEVKLHAYTETLANLKEQIIKNRVLDKRLDTFMAGPAEAEVVMQQLQKSIDKEIEGELAKVVGKLEEKYGRRADKTAAKEAGAKVLPMETAKKAQERSPADLQAEKKKAVREAMRPAFEDIGKWLAGSKKSEEVKKDGKKKDDDDDKPGLLEKWFGKKKAA